MDTRTRTSPTASPTTSSKPSSKPSPTALLAVCATVLAFTLVACAGQDAPASAGSDARPTQGRIVIGLALPDLENDFFDELRAGAAAEAEAQNVELVVTDAGGSAATQAKQVRQLTAEDADAVILTPVNSAEAAGPVRALRRADIPVVTADRNVAGVEPDAAVSSDNTAGGWKAAATLAEMVGGEGKVVHLRGRQYTSVSRERGEGFTAGLAEHDGIKVVETVRAGFDRETARQEMTRLLAEHPGLTGVFAENDEMALGAAEALGSRAGTSVQVVGFDGSEDALAAVKKGQLAATVVQDPAGIGKLAVRNALRLAAGESVGKEIEVPVRVVRHED